MLVILHFHGGIQPGYGLEGGDRSILLGHLYRDDLLGWMHIVDLCNGKGFRSLDSP